MSGTTSGVQFSKSGEDVHMSIFQGKSLNFEVIWGGNSPVDVTGYQAALQIRDRKDRLMLELSTANGKISVGSADGKLNFSGNETETRLIDRVGTWELELTAPNGDVYRALSGIVTPVGEITQ